ncbi:MAG: YrdB family protein [Micropruina sp.]|uniref:YrdB family protein n=1 Tax=Micropruina sp. TaxID=2737536 RepID=UPI0039E6801C
MDAVTGAGPFDGASPLVAVALTVRFLLELALLAGVGVIGWQVAPGWWRWVAVIAGPAAVAVLWGLFLSPRAAVMLPEAARLAIETVLFLGAGAGLFALGFGVPAVVGFVLWALDRAVLALG